MIVVLVTFPISSDLDAATLKEKFLETAPMYQETRVLSEKTILRTLSTIRLEVCIALIRWRTPKVGLTLSELPGLPNGTQSPISSSLRIR